MFTVALVVCLLVIAATVLRTRPWRVDNLVTRLPAELPRSVPAEKWEPPDGAVLVGVTNTGAGTVTVDGHPFAVWRHGLDPHLLVCGPSGTGKTVTMRWFALALIHAGYDVAFADGKSGGSFAPFAGRERVLGVADEPGEWVDMIQLVQREMQSRFTALRAWRYGTAERPETRPVAFVADELVDICRMSGKDFVDPLGEVVRMGREANGRVLASVLRPDVAEALPGLVRDSLSARVFLGAPSQTAARMMFDDKAKRAREVGEAGVRGRGVALLGGRVHRIQIPFFDADGPGREMLPPVRDGLTAFEEMVTSGQSLHSRIAELRAEGIDYKTVAQRLNADGHRQRGGKLWTQAAVRLEDGKRG